MENLVNEHALVNANRIAHGVHGDGRPVVLIHGTPSSSYIWRNVLPALVESGHKVHIYDLLGFGLSERPWDTSVDTSVTGQVSILEGLFSHWGLTGAHVISHDIGGGIAQRFSLLSQRQVLSLTMIDTVSFDSWPSRRTRKQIQVGLASLAQTSAADHEAHFRDWLLSAVHNKERFARSSLEKFLGYICNPVGQASLLEHQVRHYDSRHTEELAPRMAELGRIPVQLIWGADDSWQIVDWAYRLQAAIPRSELHVLEDCGHFAMEDQPRKISHLLIDFLERQA